MGTRADFYIGRGENAEWIGSVAWDGYPDGIVSATLYDPETGNTGDRDAEEGEVSYGLPTLFEVPTEEEFRQMVTGFLENRQDGTKPADGWPWPWKDSGTTDYSYAWDGDQIYISNYGSAWQDKEEHDRREAQEDPPELPESAVFPNMEDRQNVTLGQRSGVIIVGG